VLESYHLAQWDSKPMDIEPNQMMISREILWNPNNCLSAFLVKKNSHEMEWSEMQIGEESASMFEYPWIEWKIGSETEFI